MATAAETSTLTDTEVETAPVSIPQPSFYDGWIVYRSESGVNRFCAKADTLLRTLGVWSSDSGSAIIIRRPQIADELARRLRRIWGGKVCVQKVRRSEIR
jgi:hypothetical protein